MTEKNTLLLIILLSLIITFTVQYIQTRDAIPVYSTHTMVSINEIMTSNKSTLFDFQGDSPDWIEMINESDTVINLEGYGLSDDPNEPVKWIFPHCEIQPGEFLVVFASGKDIVNSDRYIQISG